MKKQVSSIYLLMGAVYALEQCGLMLHDANCLYRDGAYGSALALGAFAREELGRARILFDLRSKVLAGEAVSIKDITDTCDDHVTKQEWAVLSTMMVGDNQTVLGKLLQTRFRANPQSKEWKAADRELKKIDDRQRKRAPQDRHKQRMRAIYVEPDDSGTRWNRPRDVDQRSAYDFLMHAANDYAGQLQKVDPGLLKGFDDPLLQELTDWSERPTLPMPEWPSTLP